MNWSDAATRTTLILCSMSLMGAMMVGCSSAPEPQAEPSKKEIRQDADGFFKKMGQEEEAKPVKP